MSAGRSRSRPARCRVGPVRQRRTFDRLRRTPRRGRHGPISIRFVPETSWSEAEVAYVIGRSIGGAVVRNRLRRRLRAILADPNRPLAPGAYLVRAEPGAAELDFAELRRAVHRARERAAPDRTGPSRPEPELAGSTR